MIDVVRELGVEITERVVRERGEVDHGLVPFEVARSDVANVAPHRPYGLAGIAERARLIEVRVETDRFVAGLEQHRYHPRPDVAVVTCHEDSHRYTTTFVA